MLQPSSHGRICQPFFLNPAETSIETTTNARARVQGIHDHALTGGPHDSLGPTRSQLGINLNDVQTPSVVNRVSADYARTRAQDH